jgi:hypothetical protein
VEGRGYKVEVLGLEVYRVNRVISTLRLKVLYILLTLFTPNKTQKVKITRRIQHLKLTIQNNLSLVRENDIRLYPVRIQ